MGMLAQELMGGEIYLSHPYLVVGRSAVSLSVVALTCESPIYLMRKAEEKRSSEE